MNETLHPSEQPVHAVAMGATYRWRLHLPSTMTLGFQVVESGRIITVVLDPQDALLLARNIHDAIEGNR